MSQIAEAVGALVGRTLTRSAVAGRIRKLGLVGKGAPDRSFAEFARTSGQILARVARDPDVVKAVRVLAPPQAKAAIESRAPAAQHPSPAPEAPMSHFSTSDEVRNPDMPPAPEPVAQPGPIAEPIRQPEPGTWRLPELGPAQCRFACTGFHAAAAAHRFCGQPSAWLKGKPTSWCAEHLPVVMGAPGRSAGGLSVADAARANPQPEPTPPRRGWGATGVASR